MAPQNKLGNYPLLDIRVNGEWKQGVLFYRRLRIFERDMEFVGVKLETVEYDAYKPEISAEYAALNLPEVVEIKGRAYVVAV